MNYTVDQSVLTMIGEFADAFGPSGFEEGANEVGRKYASDFCDVREDNIRNLYLTPKKQVKSDRPMLLIDAHGDEVGMMVHSVKPNGTIRFVALGGWNLPSLPSTKVLVRNRDGKYIKGVIASKPVHFMTTADKNGGAQSISDFVIDVGATSQREAVEDFGIRMGEPIVPDVAFDYDAERDLMFGKGFDCRIGCAAVIETMRRLEKENLSVDITGTLSSQEEVGERGACVVRNAVQPQIAICFEGCPADDTFTEPYAIQTALKKGPMLRFFDRSMITHPRFIRFAVDLGEKLGIPVQTSVREGGGTNGGVLHNANLGIPTIVIGVPVRYIHAPQGITSYYDFEASVQLAVEVAKALTPEVLAGF